MRKSLIAAATAASVAAGAFTAPAHAAEESTADGVVQAYMDGSSLPDSYNPIDLFKREIGGWEKMFSGDIEMSAEGSAESSSGWLLAFAVTAVIGQIVQIVAKNFKF